MYNSECFVLKHFNFFKEGLRDKTYRLETIADMRFEEGIVYRD